MFESVLSTPGTPDRIFNFACGMIRGKIYQHIVILLATDPEVPPAYIPLFFKIMRETHNIPAERFMRIASSTRTMMPLSVYLFQRAVAFTPNKWRDVYTAAHPYITSYAFLLDDSDTAGWTCAHVICSQHNTDALAFIADKLGQRDFNLLLDKKTVNGETPLWSAISAAATLNTQSPEYAAAIAFIQSLLAIHTHSQETLAIIAAEAGRLAAGSVAKGIPRNRHVLAVTTAVGITQYRGKSESEPEPEHEYDMVE